MPFVNNGWDEFSNGNDCHSIALQFVKNYEKGKGVTRRFKLTEGT